MSAIQNLQSWYLSQCNEDWEHTYGVTIGTLDNPGWSLAIDLVDTDLEGVEFAEKSYGIGEGATEKDQDWLTCKVESGKFIGYGGPQKLEEIINVFLLWANENA